MPTVLSRRRIRPAALLTAFLLLGVGCKGSLDVEDAFFGNVPIPNIQITILSGDNQNVPVGEEFPAPVVVLVLRDGVPFVNATLNNHATVPSPLPDNQPVNGPTGADGRASIRKRMGTVPGPFSLRIYYLHCPKPAVLPTGDSCGTPLVELGAVTAVGTVVAATP